jgi:hypothetical protein
MGGGSLTVALTVFCGTGLSREPSSELYSSLTHRYLLIFNGDILTMDTVDSDGTKVYNARIYGQIRNTHCSSHYDFNPKSFLDLEERKCLVRRGRFFFFFKLLLLFFKTKITKKSE